MQDKVRDPSEADIALQTFLDDYIQNEAEWRPDKDQRFLNTARTPSIRALYVEFLKWSQDRLEGHGDKRQDNIMSDTHFYKRFKQWYPLVKIPKTNKFAQCDVCLTLKEKIALSRGVRKDIYREQLRKHLDDVRRDKAKYYGNR